MYRVILFTLSFVAFINAQDLPVVDDSSHGQQSPEFSIQAEISGEFSSLSATLNQDVDFVVTIKWKQTIHPVLIQPDDDSQMKKFDLVNVNSENSKKYVRGENINQTQFTYKLKANTLGQGSIGPLSFSYEVLGQKRYLDLPKKEIEIEEGVQKFLKKPILIAAIIATLILVFIIFLIRKKKKDSFSKESKFDYEAELLHLKKRLKHSGNSDWLKDLHDVLVHWLQEELDVEETKIDSLINQYLNKDDSYQVLWNEVLKECHHALYAGGVRKEFENRETLKKVYTILAIEEEQE